HVRLDLRGRARDVVYADLVDDPEEVEAAGAPAQVDVDRRVVLGGGDRPRQHAVIEHAVDGHVERLRRGVVNAGDVVERVKLKDGRAVALDVPNAVGDHHSERAHAGVCAGLELPAIDPAVLGDDLAVVGRVGGDLDPRLQRHAAGQL